MNITSCTTVVFSPTGTSRTIARSVASATGYAGHHVDVTYRRAASLSYGPDELLVVAVLGLDPAKAAAALKNFQALPGRGMKHLLKLPAGGTYTLIDDSYSGQPEAMKLAIETLGKRKTSGRKIAVLGKMAELGETSRDRHIEIGKALAATDVDIVVGVCPEMKDMLAQLPDRTEKHYFENKEGLDEFLLNKLLQNNDIVLIKGARYSSKLYQVAESLIRQGDVNA